MDTKPTSRMSQRTKSVVLWLVLLTIFMFFFGYMLVPLYNVMCKALGINGKPSMLSFNNTELVDMTRTIRVQFIATNNASLPWDFRPKIKQIELHPGENAKLAFFAQNNSDRLMTVQAVPSITPGLAAVHLKKTECFCFTQQTLKPHQSMDMPLIFHLDNTLPKNINEVTLSYTLFEFKKPVDGNKIQGKLVHIR